MHAILITRATIPVLSDSIRAGLKSSAVENPYRAMAGR